MDTVHLLLAWATVAAVVGGIGWSGYLGVTRHDAGSTFERFQAGVVALLVVAAASGLLMLMTGARPADILHLLYAALAVGLIPLARSFLGALRGRRAGVLMIVAFAVLGAIVYRLFATG